MTGESGDLSFLDKSSELSRLAVAYKSGCDLHFCKTSRSKPSQPGHPDLSLLHNKLSLRLASPTPASLALTRPTSHLWPSPNRANPNFSLLLATPTSHSHSPGFGSAQRLTLSSAQGGRSQAFQRLTLISAQGGRSQDFQRLTLSSAQGGRSQAFQRLTLSSAQPTPLLDPIHCGARYSRRTLHAPLS